MSFLTSLSFSDLERLREVVRKVHMANWPVHQISNRECDKMIDALGPAIFQQEIERMVDHQKDFGVNGVPLVPSDRPDETEAEQILRKQRETQQ